MAAIAPEQAPAEVTGELKHLKLGRWWPGAESNHRHADFQPRAQRRV